MYFQKYIIHRYLIHRFCKVIFILKDFAVDGSDDLLLRKQSGTSERNFRFAALNLQIMATFFGEVLSVSSRAVEDDEDDLSENEEDEQIRRELEEKRQAESAYLS